MTSTLPTTDAAHAGIAPYQDPSLTTAERVRDLLGRMTVEEKVGQMLQLDARDDLRDHVLRRHVGSKIGRAHV